VNTGLVAGVISLTEEKPFQMAWLHCFYWAFPYFLLGAVAAGLVTTLSQTGSWVAGLLVLPLIYLCHLWYQIHVQRTVRVQAALPKSDDLSPVLVED
jgi:membrane protein DedA with SNARE-associated domain